MIHARGRRWPRPAIRLTSRHMVRAPHPVSRRPCRRRADTSALPNIQVALRRFRSRSFAPSGRSSPLGPTKRYRVWRVTPNSLHRSPTLVSRSAIAACARRSLAGVVSRPKAAIVADHLNAIVSGGNVARAIAARILATQEQEPDVAQALTEADIIIDATASLV